MGKGTLPSISVRRYIKWGHEPAGENTSTLVLTSPLKSFVDIRIRLPLPLQSSSECLPISNLEWAFAGSSSSTPATGDRPAHTVWKHWVDSIHKEANEVKDEGDMLVQENGEVLERGTMVNPHTGLLTPYEECWDDVKPFAGSGDNVGWVLICEQDINGTGAKGMILRVGAQAQGIVRLGEEVSVARWNLKGDGVWERTIGIGSFQLWAGVQSIWMRIAEGEVVMDQNLEWHCVEKFEWE